MNKPSFLCIGAQKAGTTWLFEVLREHKDIWLGPFKEYQYFNSLFLKEDALWTPWHIEMSVQMAADHYFTTVDRSRNFRRIRTRIHNYFKYHINSYARVDTEYLKYLKKIADPEFMFSESWYEHIFSRGGERVKGDISPAYCSIPPEGINYVATSLGAVPIIYLVRDPLSRALSQLRMNIDRNDVPLPTNRTGWQQLVFDSEIEARGDYSSQITNWLANYPNRQLLFLPYNEISENPVDVLRRVERHIGVSAHEQYSAARNRVFEGKKISLPRFVTEMMRERVQIQYDFLESAFGRDFVARL